MPFTHIQGQDSALATLSNTLIRNRLGHAYLFIGPVGVGKRTTALALAQAVLCKEKPHDGCGVCPVCTQVTHGTHPDLLQIAPEAGKHSVAIDQVRELQRLLSLRPVHGGRKVALLEEAHSLTLPAQSALLKIVEEPPGDTLLILLTVNAATLSRPLLSRCQQIHFSALPARVVETLLVQDHSKDPATAHALALYSRGSMGRAVTLDPEVFTEARRYVIEELPQLQKTSFARLSRLAEWLVANRVKKSASGADSAAEREVGDRLELVLFWYEELLRYVLLGPEGVVRHQDCLPALAQAATGLDVTEALRQLALVYDTMQALGRNANRQLAVEDMLLQLTRD
jgi:DNA polymerase-3 subunit delta'